MTEIKQISDIPGVGPTTVAKLEEAGIDTLMAVAVSPVETLADATGLSEKQARKITHTAREALEMGFLDASEYDEDEEKYYISVGSQAFDTMTGGGIKSGIITQVYGQFSSGKTQVAHQLVVNTLRQFDDGIVVYLDTENTFTKSRIREMALAVGFSEDELEEQVFKRIKYAKAYNSDHQMLLTQSLGTLTEKNIRLVIVDSITAHFRSEYTGRGTLAARQQKLAKHVSDLSVFADMYNVPVFVTNQVSASPGVMYGDPINAIGGNILQHACKVIIYIRRGKKHESGTLRVAKLVDHPSRPDGEITYIITEEGLKDI